MYRFESLSMSAEIVFTHTKELFDLAVERSAALLRNGEVVALPTETVYGLAANALDPIAVERIFSIKKRPRRNPVIVHVDGLSMARLCVTQWPEEANKLAAAFWPGPLTLILPRAVVVPEVVTAGGATVGIRWPGHPFIRAVIQRCGFPLAAPSANPSNRVSPTTAQHVWKTLHERIPLIVDGGQSQVGIESTVIDLTAVPPRLLRSGMIHEESLMAVIGDLALGFGDSEEVLKSPGLLGRHYSPKARVMILNWRDESDLRDQLAERSVSLEESHVVAHSEIPSGADFGRVAVIPHDAEAFARAIYAEMHQCDEAGARWIVVEALPEKPAWRAIADRLRRAAAPGEE